VSIAGLSLNTDDILDAVRYLTGPVVGNLGAPLGPPIPGLPGQRTGSLGQPVPDLEAGLPGLLVLRDGSVTPESIEALRAAFRRAFEDPNQAQLLLDSLLEVHQTEQVEQVAESIRRGLQGYLGQRSSPETTASIQASLQGTLSALLEAGMIDPSLNVVLQDVSST
jgi:hypothetical protein